MTATLTATPVISYTIVPGPLGLMVLAATDRGICFLGFGDDATELEGVLGDEFRAGELCAGGPPLREWATAIVGWLEGDRDQPDLPLDPAGSAFQLRVWEVLKAIPAGQTRTYRQLAADLGDPKAVRAVARACATNPVSLLIPCHRVVKTDGGLAGYRWGVERKRRLLALEGSRH